MNWGLAEHLGLKAQPLAKSIEAKALNGEKLFSITHATEPVQLCIKDHKEQLSFYLIMSPAHTLILGLPWLIRHDPHVNWRSGEIRGWGESCARGCINPSTQKGDAAVINAVSANSATDSEYPDLSSVPSCYHHLRKVFNKKKAMSLPQHPPYDCAIELLPGSNVPRAACSRSQGQKRRPWPITLRPHWRQD